MKDWVVLIACGLIGWGLVSWLMAVIRPEGTPEKDPARTPWRLIDSGQPDTSETSSDIESAWPAILQLDKNATAEEIEKAYHALLTECDKVRFSSWCSAQERQEAETRRTRICAAYEFIRPQR